MRRNGWKGVGATNSSCESGEPVRTGPAGAKGLPDHGTTGGKDAGETVPHKYLNETTVDSKIGAADAGESLNFAVPSHGS